MIIDSLTQFADGEDTGATGSNLLGDVVDLWATGLTNNAGSNVGGQRGIGNGQPMYLVVVADDDIEAGTGGTYQVQLISASDEDMTQNVTVHAESGEFDSDTGVAAGTVLMHVALPIEGVEYQRYLGVQEVVGTASTTGGQVSAFLVFDPHGWKAYPQADIHFPSA